MTLAALALPAFAHNLGQEATFLNFDRPTLDQFAARASAAQPLIKAGDTVGVVLKSTPGPGTATGAGGYMTFYVPAGVQVIGVEYVREDPAQPGTYITYPLPGPAIMPIGSGPIGQTCPASPPYANLRGVVLGPNVLGVSEKPVTDGAGCHRGTIAGVYADIGMFYSTDPRTVFQSWTGGPLVNNRGVTMTPTTIFDAYQELAYGVRSPVSPILDPLDGRGNAPWGLASAVAGPQSGYAWQFDKDIFDANPARPASDYLTVGPWQRIQYPGSQIAKDQAGLVSSVLGYVGVDAIQVGGAAAGVVVDAANPLPPNTNAVRIAHGGIELGRPEMVRLKVKVLVDPAPNVPPYDASGCFQIRGEAFGGDAGGEQGGKDHLWRYYNPVKRLVTSCAVAQKTANASLVPLNGTVTYRIDFINQGTAPLPNVVVTDPLPTGLTFVSATPAPSSGPNPLTWTIPTVPPNSLSTFLVTVNATSAGELTNAVTVTSNGTTVAIGLDTILVGSEPLLRYTKSVTPSSVSPGQSVQYTLNVLNDGSGPQTIPLLVTEMLPAGFNYQSLASASVNGGPLALGSIAVNATNPNRPVFSVSAPIQAGKYLSLVFNVQVGAQVPGGTYSNVVQLGYNGKVIGGTPTAPVTVAVGTIGDTVFRDWNGNSVQDATDEGIANANVGLFAGACPASGGAVQTTVTDANGKYLFNGINPGAYCVVVSGAAVTGYSGTTSRAVTIASAQSDLSIDFPLVPGGTGQIGDRVFDDADISGTFSAGDVGIPNVTVTLYEDTNGDGVIGPQDAQIATTTTDATGLYNFGGLATGLKYIVKVDSADAALATYFGGAFSNSTPLRQSSTLTAGTPVDLARDFGFVRPGSVGDQVYIDANGNGVFDAGEQGLPNVTLTLTFDANANGVADPGETQLTTTTNAAGRYTFPNLPSGNYVVTVDTTDVDLPTSLVPRVPTSRSFALASGQNRVDIDFGFASALAKTVNPTAATSGATLDYTLQPYYPGPVLLSNAQVTDPIPANATYVAGSANAGGTLDTSVVPNQVVWPLGSNAAAIPGVIPSAGLAYCPAPALAVSITTDTYIRLDQATTNFGNNANLLTRPAGTQKKNALIAVDLSGLPAGAVIQSATFRLRSENNRSNHFVEIHRALTAWTEGNSTAGSGATWNTRNGSNGWASGAFSASDYDPTVVAIFRPAGGNKFVSVDVTSLVKQWYANPATNLGMVLLATGTDAGDATWSSSDDGTAANRPSVTIKYVLQQSGTPGAIACQSGSPPGNPDVLTADIDTFVDSNAPTANNGAAAEIRSQQSANQKRPLIHFDLGGIPQGATISSAQLSVFPNAGNAPHTDEVRRMLTPFGAGANWNTRDGINAWAGGSIFSSADYSGTTSATVSVAATGAYVTNSIAALVNGWVNGGLTNNGLALVPPGSDANEIRYGSAENGTAGKRPILAVTWQQLFSNQIGTQVDLHASPLLLTGTGAINVTMTVNAQAAIAGVTAPAALTITASGLTSASCGAPSPSGPLGVTPATPATFTYACTVTAGSLPGTVSFAGAPTAAGGVTFVAAKSEDVIVTPALTFQATVNAGATGAVTNVGTFSDDGAVSVDATAVTNVGAGIAGKVFLDANANGVSDGGETGVGGVQVCANNGGPPVCVTTAADGSYAFTGLSAATWTVTETIATFPPGTVATTVTSRSVSVAALQQVTGIDFGLKPWQDFATPGTIGDQLWVDANADGVLDASEALLAGVTVRLWIDGNANGALDGSDTLIATTTTDASGTYQFTNLAANRYVVEVDSASGPLAGSNFGVVSLSGAPVATNPPAVIAVNLAAGSTVATADFGFFYTGVIGDQLFYDTNGNGVQDGGELPTTVPVTVALFNDVDADGEFTPGIDTIVTVQQSDASGKYFFRNLPPGQYIVKPDEQGVPDPNTGVFFSMVPTAGGERAVTLAAGQQVLTADFGFASGAVVEGAVFQDNNVNALFDAGDAPLSGITVTLTGTDVNNQPVSKSTTTDVNGEFQFLVLAGNYTVSYSYAGPLTATTTPSAYIIHPVAGEEVEGLDFGRILPGAVGDTIFADNNGNGAQDAGEPGLAGVRVELYQGSTFTTLLGATTTDGSGKYSFLNLADGTYGVRVDTSAGSLPSGYATTPTGDPDPTKDGRATATLSGGGKNLTLDFGYAPNVPVFSVSGNVWQDNGAGGGVASNGIRDGAEPPIAGVNIAVAVDIDHDGIADLNFVVVTDASGNYVAGGLPTGADVALSILAASLPPGAIETGDPNEAGHCIVCDGKDAVAGIGANVTNRNYGFAFPINPAATDADVAIAKSGTAAVGSNGAVSYTLVVTNNGSVAADGAIVTDPAVANFTATTLTCGSPSGGAVCPTVPNTTIALLQSSGVVIPTLPNGGSVTFTLGGTAGVSGSIANVANVAPPAGLTDPQSSNNSSTANTTISTEADLAVTKMGSPNPYVPGAALTYTIVVTNLGPADAPGARVQDALPAALSAFTWTCVPSGVGASCATGSGTGDIDVLVTLPAGTHATFTVSGTVPAATSGALTNTTTVTPPIGVTDPVPGNNSASDTNPTGPVADLAITKVGSPNPYVPGAALTYTMVVTNAGPSNATNARVQDALPAALSAFTWTCAPSGAGASCATASGAGDIDALVTLPAGTQATFTVTGTVPAGTTGALTNTGTVSPPVGVTDPVPGNNSATDTNPTGAVADLAITKVGNPDPYVPNATLTYTIVVSNAGPSNATNARVQDALPAALSTFTWTCVAGGGGAACGTASGSGNIDALVTLPATTQATFTVTGTVPAGTTGGLTNTATVTPPTGVSDPQPGNNSATSNLGATEADVSIVKSGTTTTGSNGTVSYTLVVTNNGPAAANGAVVTDPAVANFTASTLTCGSASGGAACPSVPNTTVALLQGAGVTVPTLPSGGSVTFTLGGTAAASGSIANVASIAPPTGVNDPTPGNNSSTANTTITVTVTDLAIVKSGTTTTTSNGAVSYTLVVTNNGPAAADGAVVTDPAVANFTASTVTCGSPLGGAVCPTVPNTTVALLQGGGIVIPTLPSGGSVTFALSGTAGASGSIANVANVATPNGITDSTAGNNSSTANTTITNTPPTTVDLSIVKSGPPTVATNGAVSYTLIVTNNGPAAADGAVVTDPAVANFTATTLTCASAAGGAACPSVPNTTVALLQGSGVVIPTLPSGGSVTFTLGGTAAASGNIANVANVAAPAGLTDSAPANNSSRANTTISSTTAPAAPIPTLDVKAVVLLIALMMIAGAGVRSRRRR